MAAGPLAGRVVLLTRPTGRGEALVRRLRQLGAEVEPRPTIALVPPADPGPARAAVASLDRFDWLLFTSPAGVRFFLETLREASIPPTIEAKIGALGPATARELARAGNHPTLVAEESRSEGLAAALEGRLASGERVLLVRPEVARQVLVESLRSLGARVEPVAFYRNVAAPGVDALAREVSERRFDAVVFTSPSTFRRLLEAGPADPLLRALRETAVVVIGEVTARALTDAGLDRFTIAAEPTDEAIIEAILSVVS